MHELDHRRGHCEHCKRPYEQLAIPPLEPVPKSTRSQGLVRRVIDRLGFMRSSQKMIK
jgi:hypothetical protein